MLNLAGLHNLKTISLDLSYNNILDDTCPYIRDFLAQQKSLRKLVIDLKFTESHLKGL